MYRKSEHSILKHIDFLILDSVMIQIAFIISNCLWYGFQNPYSTEDCRQLAIIMGALLIFVSFMTEGYKNILRRGYLQELRQCAKVVSSVFLLLVAYLFVVRTSSNYSRYVILMCWIIGLYLIYIEHIIWKSVLINKMRRDIDQRQILLMVSNVEMAQEVLEHFADQEICDFRVIAVVLPEKTDDALQKIKEPLIFGAGEALQFVSNHVVDEVFIYTTLEQDVPNYFIEDCLNMGVVIHRNIKEMMLYEVHQHVTKLGDYMVLTMCINSATTKQLFLKRFMDIAGSIVGLIFFGIAFLFVAPIIKIQSPGPVIFKQKRVGKNGRQFYIYKFRSMYMDAEERKKDLMDTNRMKGPISKFENDPRIFPFGRFMRRCSIDELPQFWNILKGDMSLVGTRPPTLDEYEQYEIHHRKRLAAKPGLTGLWQVSGRNDVEDFEEIIRLDSQYIMEWSLSLDIKIICYTVAAVLGKKGAG